MSSKIIVSPLLAVNTPFIEFNDGTRLQMAHQQARQAVPLVNSEIPIVQTTLENQTPEQNLFSPELIIATKSGIVLFSTTRLMIVRYEDGKYDYWNITPKHIFLPTATEFDYGDILAQIPFYFIDTTIAQGKNLLVAIMSHPYAYEDALVISEKAREKLKSWEYKDLEFIVEPDEVLLNIGSVNDYKIIPASGDKFKAGDPFLRVKKMTPKTTFKKPRELSESSDIEIVDVQFYGTDWNHSIREYSTRVSFYIRQSEQNFKKVQEMTIPERYKHIIANSEFFYPRGSKVFYAKKKFKGLYLKITYKYIEEVSYGDKFSNRFANKSTISYFAPEGTLPTMDNNEADVIVSPMSVISRMNLGQLYESFASGLIYYLIKKVYNTKDLGEAKELIYKFYDILDQTKDRRIISYIKNRLSQVLNFDSLTTLEFIYPAPPFENNPKVFPKLAKLVNYPIFFGDHKIHMGYMYFYRLVHIARHKVAGRSIGPMSKKTLQPLSGTGSQRLGEMEVWNLLAYNANFNIKEMLTTKSDDIEKKIAYIINTVYGENLPEPKSVPESVKLMESYFSILGAKLTY